MNRRLLLLFMLMVAGIAMMAMSGPTHSATPIAAIQERAPAAAAPAPATPCRIHRESRPALGA